jgi:hypothetical protein
MAAVMLADTFFSPLISAGLMAGVRAYLVTPGPQYYRSTAAIGGWAFDHSRAHEWYTGTVVGPAGADGFPLSPFVTRSTAAMFRPAASSQKVSTAATLLGGFETFGDVQADVAGYVLREAANCGLTREWTLPVNADLLRFTFHFITAGDGDFVTVRIGDGPTIFTGSDTAAARLEPVAVEIPVDGFAGETRRIVIKLVSRGAPNAVVRIDGIDYTTNDDADADGLTLTEEAGAGTSPQLFDTDGDGLSDAEEIRSTGTNPLFADSDGDGVMDGSEISAGTNPLSQASVFATTEFTRTGPTSSLIRWSGVVGKRYRVLRSATADFADYDTVASRIAGVVPLTSYLDATVPETARSMFYRVAIEE